jgi:PTS system nitrogen regulatory IIA component
MYCTGARTAILVSFNPIPDARGGCGQNSKGKRGDQTMKILDVLVKEAINVDLKAKDKQGILEELVQPIARMASIKEDELVKVLIERERLGSTGIGAGIGIPHGKFRHLNSLMLGFGISRQGVDFESIDGRPTHIFFLLLTPENSAGLHLKLLAQISRLLKNDEFKNQLSRCTSAEEVLDSIRKKDEEF